MLFPVISRVSIFVPRREREDRYTHRSVIKLVIENVVELSQNSC